MTSASLIEVMNLHVTSQAKTALACWDGQAREYVHVPYATLSKRAFAFGQHLIDKTDTRTIQGRVVMIACHSPYATLVAFYGAVSVGAIPIIFPMPLSLGSHEALTERIRYWGFAFEAPAMLVLEEGLEEKFHAHIPNEIGVLRLNDDPRLDAALEGLTERSANDYTPQPDDIAFFQTTSSSTGDHKAVAISHRNILSNIRGIRSAVNMDDQERMASWLPLFHDMGLVGTVLFCFCNNYTLFISTPTQFVKRPALWLKTLHEQRCTIATAPNFGFDYCSRLVSEKDRDALDLSHVKHLFIGAEPIRVSTIQSFLRKFSSCGVTPQVMRPAYGLAESTIITSISSPQKLARFICVDGDSIAIGERLRIIDSIDFSDAQLDRYQPSQSIAVCTAGTAIDQMTIEIIDENGQTIEDSGITGEIVITGDSVAMGYVWGGQPLIDEFAQQRVRTGDIGVIHEQELYILERMKNIVIRNGENYLVSALEEQLAELLSISHEHVAVFESDIHDPNSDIVVLVERHATIDDQQIDQLLVSMPKEAFPINRILLARSREIPRTTSGKKRHFYCRKLYQSGDMKFQQDISVSPQRIIQAQARQN